MLQLGAHLHKNIPRFGCLAELCLYFGEIVLSTIIPRHLFLFFFFFFFLCVFHKYIIHVMINI